MKAALFIILGTFFLAQQQPDPCMQAKEIRLRLGENLDGLMYMPSDSTGRSTDSLITIRQWVEKLEAKCDSLKNNEQ